MGDFARRVIGWQRRHGRSGLPWQGTRDPYRIWVSEIMLQQTQVATVVPYFERFIARFPDVAALASAEEGEVLVLWSGLGYYSRGRNLHAAARRVMEVHGGRFPSHSAALEALPGIGRSTAAAVAAFADGERAAILDGNVKRVLARAFGIPGWPGDSRVAKRLWELASALLPDSDIEAYTQGMMDLGATVCLRSRPLCDSCPLAASCIARIENRVAELPGPRPRRVLPARETAFLLLLDRRQIMLERRPPAGIWGGLWCPPELPVDCDAVGESRRRFGVAARPGDPLAPIDHGFTHFRLRIHPRLLRVESREARAEQGGRVWLPLEDAIGAAIPAPVRRLLQSIARLG